MIIPFSFWNALPLLFLPVLSFAQLPATDSQPLHIRHTKDFIVTGEGSAAEWGQTQWVVVPRRTGTRPPAKTTFKMLYSDSGIYCLYHCDDKKITATMTTDFSDLYNEDDVETFFQPDDSLPLYFEYELSPLDHELPLLIPNIKGDHQGWLPWHYEGNRKTRHAVHIGRNGDSVVSWTGEFFIPFGLLRPIVPIPPHKGTRWKANFYRIDYDQGIATWQWNLVPDEEFHDYKRFGTILFD